MDIDETQLGKGIIDRPDQPADLRDYRHDEIAGAMAPAVWTEKAPGDFFTLPPTNQAVASDCVAFKWAKQLGVENMNLNGGIYRRLSAHSIYPYGFVQGGGMSIRGSAPIVCARGATLEELFPSDNLTEAQAEDPTGYPQDAKTIALIFRPDSVVFANPDFETIASIIYNYRQAGQKKAVGIAVMGKNNSTWLTTTPQPPQTTTDPTIWYHALTVTDYGLMGGQKFLAVSNNWGSNIGQNGTQFLGQNYEPFIYSADYVLKAAYGSAIEVPPPVHTWTQVMQVGATGPEVLVLQQALQSMGMFPSDKILKPTGYFGGITRDGIQTFQDSFILPRTGIFDTATMAKFNEIFGGAGSPASEAEGEAKP